MDLSNVKTYLISWLDWAANYAREDPYDFLSRLFLMLLPLFALSGALSWYLAKEIDRENKKKEKQENKMKAIQKAAKKAKQKKKQS